MHSKKTYYQKSYTNSHLCIHQLFEQKVKEVPNQIAVKFLDETLTFQELNERANQLAGFLYQSGVQRNDSVIVCLDRSIELVVSLLAILKTGAAYVPIDPEIPKNRLKSIVKQLNYPFVLTNVELNKSLFETTFPSSLKKILVDDTSIWTKFSKENLLYQYDVNDLMYIIFTSGSTGEPKGVMNTHLALNNRLQWMQEYFRLSPEDCVLQKTPYTFDVSVWEFFWPLIAGGTLVIAKPNGHKDPSYLRHIIQKEQITVMHFVPSMLDVYLDSLDTPKINTSLKQVICSGEALSKKLELKFFEHFSSTHLFNLYGPTEAAIDVSFWECNGDPLEAIVPIGYSIANMYLHILNSDFEEVQIGEIGELYIEGVGLAKGYYNAPEITAAAFLPSPFNTNSTIYKTGDLCRYLKNGAIEYVGRKDSQVKIRGFRIELSEIENVLISHQEINKAIVIVNERLETKQIIAYVQLQKNHVFEEHKLREYVKEFLPEYMIPTFFVPIETFPLLPNGKIDRKKLPDVFELIQESTMGTPLTTIEKQIQLIWTKLLGIQNIQRGTSFFHLGGDSLFVARLVNHLKSQFCIAISFEELFKHATIAEQAELISLKIEKNEKRSLLNLELNTSSPTLSDAQKSLWFLEKFNKHQAVYNLPHHFTIEGDLDVSVLVQSLKTLINYQEIFQYTIFEKDGAPFVKLQIPENNPLKFVDYSELEEAIALNQAFKEFKKDAAIPFTFDGSSLYRMILYKISSNKFILYYNLHHIISDGLSDNLFKRQLFTFYYKIKNQEVLPSKPTVQYMHYIGYENEFSKTEAYQQQLDFWKKTLPRDDNQITLFQYKPEIVNGLQHGQIQTFNISPTLFAQLEAFCKKKNYTPYMVLLSVYQLMINKLSGENHINIGTPVAGRKHSAFEHIIGLFVNTIVIPKDTSSLLDFEQFLEDTRKNVLTAFSNDEVAFDRIVEAINPIRKQYENPLFQYMFSLSDMTESVLEFPHISVGQTKEIYNNISKFDLTLTLKKETGQYEGIWEYRTDLFDETLIHQLSEIYLYLLTSILEQPSKKLNELALLSNEVWVKYNHLLNDTSVPFPNKCLHTLFEEQVKRTPNHTAVIYEDHTLTYAQLNDYAEKLASIISKQKVSRNSVIGLKVDRSLEMIVGIFGILKAGCAYLPIDTNLPEQRIQIMLKDAASPFCITDTESDVIENANSVFYYLNLSKLNQVPKTTANDRDTTLDELVSVYYTSGSTGNPKGVASTHRGWVNRMCWMQRKHQFKENEVTLQKTTLSFDDAAVEIFWPLLTGGTVALLPPEYHKDPSQILNYAVRYNVSLLQFVPSMLQMVLQQISPLQKEQLTRLRVVVSSGEALKQQTVNEFYLKMPGKLFNTWGATEVSIDSTCFSCHPSSSINGGDVVSIGTPIDNNQIYILDDQLMPVPYGVIGDLYIGGIGLANGYLNNAEKTNEVFIQSPFNPVEKIYKTGDRGYLNTHNQLMFIGRDDNQIKIRGMRVELGEIEQAIINMEMVEDAIVLEHNSRLVAYYISSIEATEIKSHLKTILPEHMLPHYYYPIEEFPLNSNGKRDIKSLPEPMEIHLIAKKLFTPPENTTEAAILDIWKEKIKLTMIGTHDNFFELGGHSLLAVQVITQINNTLHVNLSIKDLFENPTITALSQVIQNHTASTEILAIQKEGNRQKLFPLSAAQKRIWFLDKLQKQHEYHMPLVLKLNGHIDVARLEECIQSIRARHEILRTNFIESHGTIYQKIHSNYSFTLDKIEASHVDLNHFIKAHLANPFDLENDDLIRGTLIQTDSEDILVMVMHHIISDGWSLQILKKELCDLYNKIPLLTEPVQYADYALFQESLDVIETKLPYWKEQFHTKVPVLNLPKDLSNVVAEVNETIMTYMSPLFAQKTKEFCRTEKVTPFMFFLSVFYILLSRLSNEKDIVVGTPQVNRTHMQLENAIGIYLNTLPLRQQISDQPFNEFLQKVAQTVKEAFIHSDVPFEKIVEEVSPSRDLHRNPLFDVMLNYYDFGKDAEYQMDKLTVTEIPVENILSKFLLTLYIEETSTGFRFRFAYKNDSFSKQQIQEFSNQFLSLVHELTENPIQSIFRPALLTENGQDLLPVPTKPLSTKKYANIVERLDIWAHQAPERIAIELDENYLTYKELNDYSNYLAHDLIESGVHYGETVAIYGERSEKIIIAMLACLRIGSIFVNLDDKLPPTRSKLMLQQADAQHILFTTLPTQDVLQQINNLPVNHLQLKDFKSLKLEYENRLYVKNFHSNAYIFFTSGTTGMPKGVLGKNNSLSHFLDWQSTTYAIQESDRFAQLTNISFDVYLRDVFVSLISGATLVIPSNDILQGNCLAWLNKEKITAIHTVPSLSNFWLNHANNQQLSHLRHIFFAGEPLPLTIINKWRMLTSAELHNFYGPTETTLAKASYTIPKEFKDNIAPIGLGISESQLLILNEKNQLCGLGEIGEIVIRTPYLTNGYLDNNEIFIENPFSLAFNDLLYKSGDLGRYTFQGNIEILGRRDEQVKINGVKIDKNEVTAVISKHPSVQQCLLTDVTLNDSSELIAFIQPINNTCTVNDIRGWLAQHLPLSMIPKYMKFTSEFFVTSNGKVDKNKMISKALDNITTPLQQPTFETKWELRLGEIWMELFQTPVTPADNFFELGGHSLLILKLMARLQEKWQVKCELIDVFYAPTIRELASKLEVASQQSTVPKIQRINRKDFIYEN